MILTAAASPRALGVQHHPGASFGRAMARNVKQRRDGHILRVSREVAIVIAGESLLILDTNSRNDGTYRKLLIRGEASSVRLRGCPRHPAWVDLVFADGTSVLLEAIDASSHPCEMLDGFLTKSDPPL